MTFNPYSAPLVQSVVFFAFSTQQPQNDNLRLAKMHEDFDNFSSINYN